jgi:hypothetical protein
MATSALDSAVAIPAEPRERFGRDHRGGTVMFKALRGLQHRAGPT